MQNSEIALFAEGGAVGVPWQIGTRTGTPTVAGTPTAGRGGRPHRDVEGTRGTPTPGRVRDAGGRVRGTPTERRDVYEQKNFFLS